MYARRSTLCLEIPIFPRDSDCHTGEMPCSAPQNITSRLDSTEASWTTKDDTSTIDLFRQDDSSHPGRASVIHDHCRRAQNEGSESCVWVCIQRGRRIFAIDQRLEELKGPLRIHGLHRNDSWWKRHSPFSGVAVREVKVRATIIPTKPISKLIECQRSDFSSLRSVPI